MKELTTETDSFFRPNFSEHPDILPHFLQWGGKPAFTIRAVLGSTLSPLWGIYSGFELFENAALAQGREEYLNSEKFQYRPRDWKAAEESGETLSMLLGRLNQIRKEHPALQQPRNLHFHHARTPMRWCTPRRSGDDVVIVVIKPRSAQHRRNRDLPRYAGAGSLARDVYLVHDEITGRTWRWGQHAFVSSHDDPAHILTLIRYGSRSAASGPATTQG